MNRIISIAVTALLIAGAIFGPASARQVGVNPSLPKPVEFLGASDYKVLKGMKGVYILVEAPTKDETDIGLTKIGIQNAAELSLRRNGIKVSTHDPYGNNGAAQLYINIRRFKNAFSIFIRINDAARLERNPKIRISDVTIWEKGGIGHHNEAPELLYGTIEKYTDTFCLDYLKANPKK